MVLKVEAHPRSYPSFRGTSVREFNSKSRIYVWERGETIMQNLLNRRNRPTKLYRELLKDEQFMDGARWSQTAGCSCGCSPGFIASARRMNLDNMPLDYHVEVCATEDLYNAVSSIAQMTLDLASPATYLDLVAA
jgi:hypothetical protein